MNLKNKDSTNVYWIQNENNNILKSSFLEKRNILSNKKDISINNNLINTKENTWKIEIPKINLVANIAEGTTEEILNTYVGHFEETQKQKGNIGLAAHNRGYPVNFFNRLKELEIEDEIIYTYGETSIKYKVKNISIIEDTNWKVLENTEENKLTLITCVEDKPSYRRCVQAIQEK